METHLLVIYDNRDYKDFNELTIKTLFLALLHHTNLYIMDSEPALQRTYADLTMIICAISPFMTYCWNSSMSPP